jgi:4-amino-4-deoxy-L-arabinose transferase-like glycosyltransferase
MKIEKKILSLLILFFLIRIIFIFASGGNNIAIPPDGTGYIAYAKTILTDPGWIMRADFQDSFRAPIYPLFLSFVYRIFGVNNIFVYVIQSLINTFLILAIYKFAQRFFNEKVALLSFIWAGIYFWYINYSCKILRESLVFFLFFISFYYLWDIIENIKKRNGYLSFLAFVLSWSILIHTDPKFLFYLPFLGLIFLIFMPFKKAVIRYLLFLTILVLVGFPWFVRNYKVYNGPVIISERVDLRDIKKTYISKAATLGREKRNKIYNKEYPSELERIQIKNGLNPNNRSTQEVLAILDNVYPTKNFLEREMFYFRDLWFPYRFESEYRPWPDCRFCPKSILNLRKIGKLIFYGSLLPFMVLSIIYFTKKKQIKYYFLIIPIVIQTILHLLTWSQFRYRIPVDAFVIILGCNGMYIFYYRIKKLLGSTLKQS